MLNSASLTELLRAQNAQTSMLLAEHGIRMNNNDHGTTYSISKKIDNDSAAPPSSLFPSTRSLAPAARDDFASSSPRYHSNDYVVGGELQRLAERTKHAEDERRRVVEECARTVATLEIKLNGVGIELERYQRRCSRLDSELTAASRDREALESELALTRRELSTVAHAFEEEKARAEELKVLLDGERRDREHHERTTHSLRESLKLKEDESVQLQRLVKTTQEALQREEEAARKAIAAVPVVTPPQTEQTPTPPQPQSAPAPRPQPLPIPPAMDPAVVELLETNARYVSQADEALHEMGEFVDKVSMDLLELRHEMDRLLAAPMSPRSTSPSSPQRHHAPIDSNSIAEIMSKVRKQRQAQRQIEIDRRESLARQMDLVVAPADGANFNNADRNNLISKMQQAHVNAFRLVYDMQRVHSSLGGVADTCTNVRQLAADIAESQSRLVQDSSELAETKAAFTRLEGECERLMNSLSATRREVEQRDAERAALQLELAEEKSKMVALCKEQDERHAMRVQGLQTEHAAAQRALTEDLQRARTLVDHLEHELRETDKEKESLKQQMDQLKMKRKASRSARERLERERGELKLTVTSASQELRLVKDRLEDVLEENRQLTQALQDAGAETAARRFADRALRLVDSVGVVAGGAPPPPRPRTGPLPLPMPSPDQRRLLRPTRGPISMSPQVHPATAQRSRSAHSQMDLRGGSSSSSPAWW
eukprot:PhM_4_TR7059/c0_g1_i1/m.86608